MRFFRSVLTRHLRQSFHAVRIARPGLPTVADDVPLVVYCNHPSWWDGALVPVLIVESFPRRHVYGPIDAEALKKYGFMRRLGFFGVQPTSFAGAATFLRVGRALLADPRTLFCVTPEGRFVDARVRPVRLQSGLASLIAGVPRATLLPLAVEYAFWSERQPEALVRWGEPWVAGRDVPGSLDGLHGRLEASLASAMDALADAACSRDAMRFDTLFDGRAGVGGIYDFGRRIAAWSRGRRFDPAHAPAGGPPSTDEGRH